MHKLILTMLLIADLTISAIAKDKESFFIGILFSLLWLFVLAAARKITLL